MKCRVRRVQDELTTVRIYAHLTQLPSSTCFAASVSSCLEVDCLKVGSFHTPPTNLLRVWYGAFRETAHLHHKLPTSKKVSICSTVSHHYLGDHMIILSVIGGCGAITP